MKTKKRYLAVFLALVMCVSCLAACGSSSDSSETTTETASESQTTETESEEAEEVAEAEPEEPAHLKVWVADNLRIEDWETNDMTLWLEEAANVDLEFETLSSDDYDSKINISLTAGAIDDLPDVIMSTGTWSDSVVWSWAQAGSILPLTDYYNDPELAVNINEAKERTGVDFVNQIKSPDGNVYGVATYSQSYGNEYPDKLWIYEPWLDELGAEVPTTTEEFKELLEMVVSTDLNGNGKADEIGLAGSEILDSSYNRWVDYIMNPFVYVGDAQYRTVTDGVVGVAYNTEEYKEGIKYVKELMDEGLIYSGNLSMSSDQFKALVNTEEVTVFSFVYTSTSALNDTTIASDYICIDTLTGPEGVNYSTYVPATAGISMVVTANCEDPEAAFRLGDWMSCEYMCVTTRYGGEGINWEYITDDMDLSQFTDTIPGFDALYWAYDDTNFWNGSGVTNVSWRQTGPRVSTYSLGNGVVTLQEGDDVDEYSVKVNTRKGEGQYLYQTAGHQPDELITKLIFTEEESDAISEIESNLKTYAAESWSAFVTGNRDVDAEWDDYLATLDQIGLPLYLEVIQGAYDRTVE